MHGDEAVSEIIGAVMLIGIIVAAFGIFTAIYLPSLVPSPTPQVKLGMACNETAGPSDIEFPCTRGSFNCYAFNNKTCENDCNWRDYSANPDVTSEQQNREISRCMENCFSPICSDLRNCGVLYVCHYGGESLKISDMRIIVNGKSIHEDTWEIKQHQVSNNFVSPPDGAIFQNGDSLRILNPSSGQPVDTVIISYILPSGSEVTLAMNQFGTDIK